MGLEAVVSLSYADDQRDGRGWAFRERRGPDPVNGFRFLAEAYEATEPLWPTLARFDLSYNPLGKISERPLTSYPNLRGYARDLYQHPAFRETTDFGAFGTFAAGPRPSFVNDTPWRIAVEPVHADWDGPHRREAL